jgi:PTH1 family peptidyl-tRNA hydrolase
MSPWLIVGLGNPGPEYADTRHNVGAMVIEELATRVGGRLRAQRQTRSDVLEGRLAGERAILARPRCYMNESGGPVALLSRFFDVEPAHVVLVHDELDIPFGALRIKAGGGDNGHNGLKSVRSALGTGDTVRVRVGIGRPPGRQDPAAFVLRPFSAPERRDLALLVDRAADAVERTITQGVPAAQNRYHADPADPPEHQETP